MEHKKESKRKKIDKRVIAALLILAIFALLVFTIIKITSKPSQTVAIEKTKYTISYALYADGKLYEEKNISFFENEFSKTLGLVSDKADSYFINVSVGDEFNISLKASEAYGDYDESLRKVVPRTIKQSRVMEVDYGGTISKEQFIQIFGQEPVENQSYEPQGALFPIKVVKVNDVVEWVYDVEVGSKSEKDMLGFWFEVTAIDEANGKMKLKINGETTELPSPNGLIEFSFDENYIYQKLTPEIGKTIEWANASGKVASYNETSIVLDDNHALAGKDIVIAVKVLNITKETYSGSACGNIPNAPNFDVFIMSYCPYGLQFVKGLLPVWKEFNDKANINVRFVSYTMHGQKEVDENKRMVCIREEQCSKYMAYLECFAGSGDANACIEQVGIDKAKLNDCMANRAQSYLDYDAQLNEQYGVRGSPTVVINGKQVDVWPRSPANIAKTLCEYFDKKPSECSLSFSDENPKPGFGYGASSSNQQASCA